VGGQRSFAAARTNGEVAPIPAVRVSEIRPLESALTGILGDSYGLGYPLRVLAQAISKLPSPLEPALD